MNKNLEQRISEAVREKVKIVPYDPGWPALFEREKENLREILPKTIIKRIEHFGSTAVPGLASKPVIDMLVEVTTLAETRDAVVPILESKGYDYFWRPVFDGSVVYYAWFIKRNSDRKRTHHIHMVESDSDLWDRLYFRDYLCDFPHSAREYELLKKQLEAKYPNDRIAYTNGKTEFIIKITQQAKSCYCGS
ncbi:MAG: GrpB family protein [Chitinivibrionales bacterium]|nr:GrpB family protein [Chitinivibrionales bacterium]